VRAPADIPHADEALRVLVERFKRDPRGAAGDLSAALLERGHATEALQIADHGIHLRPRDPDTRAQRAASLLALSRPKVAYVELLRALAIAPGHRRALRLLGKVFVDAGRPERAAALLQQRHADAVLPSVPPREDAALDELPPHIRRAREAPPLGDLPPTLDGASPLPELFAALTHDLGLGPVPNDFGAGRVAVTQVVRARLKPRREGEDELSSIDGPIVDETNPGHLDLDTPLLALPANLPARPATMYDVATSPELHITMDEKLLGGAFAISPVSGPGEDADTVHDGETMDEALPSRLDLEVLRRAIEDGAPTTEQGPAPLGGVAILEETTDDKLDSADLPYLKRYARQASSPHRAEAPPLRVETPPPRSKRYVVGLLALALGLGLLLVLFLSARDRSAPWSTPSGSPAPSPAFEQK